MVDDLQKHTAKLGKSCKMLQRLCTEDDVDSFVLPKLVQELEAQEESHESLLEWAEKFGFAESNPKKAPQAQQN